MALLGLLDPTPRRATEVMQYAGCYSLDLYCDHNSGRHTWKEFPWQITGETFAECTKIAKKRGWKIHRKTRTATCPKCSGHKSP